jgi:hypothetical protein
MFSELSEAIGREAGGLAEEEAPHHETERAANHLEAGTVPSILSLLYNCGMF